MAKTAQGLEVGSGTYLQWAAEETHRSSALGIKSIDKADRRGSWRVPVSPCDGSLPAMVLRRWDRHWRLSKVRALWVPSHRDTTSCDDPRATTYLAPACGRSRLQTYLASASGRSRLQTYLASASGRLRLRTYLASASGRLRLRTYLASASGRLRLRIYFLASTAESASKGLQICRLGVCRERTAPQALVSTLHPRASYRRRGDDSASPVRLPDTWARATWGYTSYTRGYQRQNDSTSH